MEPKGYKSLAFTQKVRPNTLMMQKLASRRQLRRHINIPEIAPTLLRFYYVIGISRPWP